MVNSHSGTHIWALGNPSTWNHISLSSARSNNWSFSDTFDPILKEGHFYDMTLKKVDGTIIYKDKIFCTDQPIDQTQDQEYTINSGEYISDTTYDNDFIILWEN